MMMEGNLLLEQYGKFKKAELEGSPFRCLLNTKIEINPHQINAFCAAIQALKTGGIVLADEVGLGKTIEAGLTLKYVLDSGAKRVLIALPATLRKQWEVELEEKFSLKATILDRLTVESNLSFWKSCLENRDKVRIVITSYDYSSKLMQRFPNLKWDFIIIDEAHNLRNVFHGTKRAKRLYELSKGIPKILLTATPLQNSLSDLHGLISFIDPRIFGSEKVFNKRFIEGQDYPELKRELIPVLYRTLRRDVGKYMDFKKRECRTIDFELSPDEVELYMRVNNFLKRDVLYSIPNANKGLIVLVIRKLLASSSYALIETFEVLKNRLQKLYEGTKSANAQDGFALFWDFVEDEIDESAFEEIDDEDTLFQKQQIQAEMDEVDAIIETASRIQSNAKIKALKTAIHTAFKYQGKQNIPQKVVVFTESKRTQKYIAAELCKDGFEEDDILLFNGDFNDAMTKEIYRAWQVKNFGKTNYGRSVEYKHAIVDYFKEHSKVLIVTDAGSEGLNLQFCNTVINYDLPWNPQKIEQRIGRCHRYGQKNNVVAINLLNTTNEADRRIYEILSKKFELFDGVFGASDIALGTLESGSSFEKTILDIYQKCGTKTEFKKAFDRLDKKIDAKRNKKVLQLQSILMTASDIDKNVSLEKTNNDIKQYLKQVDFWSQVADSDVEGNLNYWKINNWGEKTFGSHGTLFIGAFCNSNNEMLFPVLLLCDEFGQYVDFSEEDIVRELETVDDIDIKYFKPTNEEIDTFKGIYNNLLQEMFSKYQEMTKPLRDYNKHKVENWVDIQREQLGMQIAELNAEIGDLSVEEFSAKEFLRKVDIRKKIDEKVKQLQKLQGTVNQKVSSFLEEAEKEIAEFNHQFDIVPVLVINVVLKF
jgi:helicase